jgi:hypothetical protein
VGAACTCDALVALRRGVPSCSACGAPVAISSRPAAEHAQDDGQRPTGVGRTRYLRAWRRGRDAGDAECRADGRARVMTAAAWSRWGASAPMRGTAPRIAVEAVRDVDVLAELGLDATRRAG